MDLHNPEKEKQLGTEFDLKEKREEMIKQFPLMWLIELLINYISRRKQMKIIREEQPLSWK